MDNLRIIWISLLALAGAVMIGSFIACLCPRPLPSCCKPVVIIPIVTIILAAAGVVIFFDFRREHLPDSIVGVIKQINMEE